MDWRLALAVFLCFLKIGVSQLPVTVEVPPWIEQGQQAGLQCNFAYSDINDVLRVFWKVSNSSVTDPSETDDLISYISGTVDGPEKNRIDLNTTTFDIVIRDVSLDIDERKYWCFVTVRGSGGGDGSGIAEVQVRPTLTLHMGMENIGDKTITVDVMKTYDFTCTAIGAKPTSSITWKIGDDIITEGVTHDEPKENQDDNRLTDTTSYLSKQFSVDEKNLTCSASLPISESPQISAVIETTDPPTSAPPSTTKTMDKNGNGDKGGSGSRDGGDDDESDEGNLAAYIAIPLVCCFCVIVIAICWSYPKQPKYIGAKVKSSNETQAEKEVFWKDGGLLCKTPCTSYQVTQGDEVHVVTNNWNHVTVPNEGCELEIRAKTCLGTSGPLHVVIPAAPVVEDCYQSEENPQMIKIKMSNYDFKYKYQVSFDENTNTLEPHTVTEDNVLSIEANVSIEEGRAFTILAASGTGKSVATKCVVQAKPQAVRTTES